MATLMMVPSGSMNWKCNNGKLQRVADNDKGDDRARIENGKDEVAGSVMNGDGEAMQLKMEIRNPFLQC